MINNNPTDVPVIKHLFNADNYIEELITMMDVLRSYKDITYVIDFTMTQTLAQTASNCDYSRIITTLVDTGGVRKKEAEAFIERLSLSMQRTLKLAYGSRWKSVVQQSNIFVHRRCDIVLFQIPKGYSCQEHTFLTSMNCRTR